MTYYRNVLKKLKEKEKEQNNVYVVEDEKGKKVNQTRVKVDRIASTSGLNRVTASEAGKVSASVKNTSSKKTTTKKNNKNTWFSKGAFSDGYQFGDLSKTVGGTVGDIVTNFGEGALNIVEGVGDLATYGTAGVLDLFGADKAAKKVKKAGQYDWTDALFDDAQKFYDDYSILGEKSDNISQGLGYVGGLIGATALTGGAAAAAFGTSATTGATIASTATAFTSSMGSEMTNAFNNNASAGEAFVSGLISGAAEAGSEMLFGGLGKTIGKGALDDVLIGKLTKKITNKTVKAVTQAGLKATGEGVEEVLAGIGSAIGKKLSYMSEEEWNEIYSKEEMLDEFINGAIISGIAQAPSTRTAIKTGRDTITGLTDNEQAVVNAEIAERVAKKEETLGRELKNKERTEIENQVQEDLQKGYISAARIENTLGKKLSEQEEANIETQLSSLLEQSKNTTDPKAQEQITSQMSLLEEQLNTSRSLDFSKDAYIQKSYQEKGLKSKNFTYEAKDTDSDIKKGLYESASKIMNNTTRTHEFVETVAKIAEDRGTKYEFTNTAALKEAGYNLEGKTVNGLVTADGKVLVNIDSNQGLDFIVGHETTHLLEGTEDYKTLQDMVVEYAKEKGIYEDRVANLNKLYEGTEADINAELTSDLVGELLFTDEKFVNNLSTKQPNLFQKIYDYIKHIYKMATAGSKEARQLEQIKRQFDKAYKAQGTQTGTKYSISDSQGRTLSKEQQEYFKDSKARDENGNLVKVYHGTNKAGFTEFKRNINFFTDSKEVAQTYTGNDGIYEGYINITNPVTIDANSEIWSKIDVDNIAIDGINDTREFLNTYGASTWKEGGKLRTSTADLVSAIEEAVDEGSIEADGVIIKNIYDEGMYGDGTVGKKLGTDYITFNKNQFKNSDNTNPTTNPDIRYSLSEEGKMVDNKGNEVKLEASEAGTHGTLMAIHNLSDFKLRGVLELGGFPVPSIAITNPKLDFANYGEISVIFDKETINPTNKENEVYGSDVYSPRFPDTVNELIGKGVKQVSDILGMSPSQFEANYEGMSKEEVANRLLREESVIDKYLESKNIIVDPIYKTYTAEQTRVPVKYIENFYNAHQELQDNDINIREVNYDDYSEEIKKICIDSLVEQGVSLEDAQDLYIDFGKADITKFLIDVKNFKKSSSQGQQIDKYATQRAKLEHIDLYSDEYRNFIEDLIAPAFGDKFIRNNKDIFTPSGNRRSFKQLHDAYNLENVVKNMKGKVRGEEGFFYGAGNIRSQVTPQFKSIADIKANEGKLVTAAQMEEVKQDIDSDLNNLSVTARNFGGYSYDSYETALNEIAGSKKITFNKAKSILSEYGFKDVPDILVNKSIEFLEKLKNAPTEYFEAKPQRAVGFNEVEAIVVPNNMSAELKQQLYNKGLNVIEYDPNIEGDRANKINELDELKFSLSSENDIAPVGNVFGKDLKVQVEEAIAPLQEKIENLTEQLDTVLNSTEQYRTEQIENVAPEQVTEQENIAPVEEIQEESKIKATQPTLEELNNLMDIKENKSGSEYAMAYFDLRDKYGQAKLFKALNEYNASIKNGTEYIPETNQTNMLENVAPASQDIVEQTGQEASSTLTDEDMLPIPEDTTPEIEDIETTTVESPFEERDIKEVGKRNVKAYMYENPEVKPFFQQEAEYMLNDLKNTVKGERVYNSTLAYEEGLADANGAYGWTGITRETTADIAYLLDNFKYTYAQIEEGLNKIIEDNGKENNAVSKRIEFMLDERLREGYADAAGYPIPANQDYIKLLEEKSISEYNSNRFKDMTDEQLLQTISEPNTDTFESEVSNLSPTIENVSKTGTQEQTESKVDWSNVEDTSRGKQQSLKIAPSKLAELEASKVDWDSVEVSQGKQQQGNEAGELTDTENVEKKTRSQIQKELLEDTGIVAESLDHARNISKPMMHNTDPVRLQEIIFGKRLGSKINETVFQKVKHNTAEKIRFQNKERNDIKELGIKPRSGESAAVQKYGEKQYVNEAGELVKYGDAELRAEFPNVETQAKIKHAAQVIRGKYDTYIDMVNAEITKYGYEPIPKRTDYMRHFQELNDVFSRYGLPFNMQSQQANDLPVDINGLTADFKPNKNFFTSALKRKGLKTTYDAITGIDGYIEGIGNLIYHTQDIQTLRGFENYVRDIYGQEHGFDNLDNLSDTEKAIRTEKIQDNHLGNYAAWLREYTNNLAGKKAMADRAVEDIFGRKVYSFLNELKSQVGSNMTGLNIGSALTNPISMTQALAKTSKLATVKGYADTIKNIFAKDNFIEQNDFLTNRFGSDILSPTAWQKMRNAGQIFMTGTDWFSANAITRSKFYELKAKGLSDTEAHKQAGDFAAKILGDRSQGATPTLYNSKMLGLVTQFQLEVNNQLYSMFYDTVSDAKEAAKTKGTLPAAAGATFVLGQLAAYQHIYNNLYESVAGRRPAFDIISIIATALGLGEDDEEEKKPLSDRLYEAADMLVDSLPYVSIFTGGGRIPVTEALPISELFSGKDQYGNEKSRLETLGEAIPYYFLPTGYGQIKKTAQGLGMYDEDLPVAGSYTKSGNLRFTAEEDAWSKIQAGLFGQWANPNAKEYIDSGFKTIDKNNIEELVELGFDSNEYRDYKTGLNKINRMELEEGDSRAKYLFEYIDSLNATDKQKSTMIEHLLSDEEAEELSELNMSIDETINYYEAKSKIAQQVADYTSDKKLLTGDTGSEEYRNAVDSLTDEKKSKIIDTILAADLTSEQKAYLYGKYYSSDKTLDKITSSGVNFNDYLRFSKDSISLESTEEKAEYLYNADLDDNTKTVLYETSVLSGFDNEDKYKDYKTVKAAGIDINSWLSYTKQEFWADKDENGESISGSKKIKIFDYIESLELSVPQKAIMFKMEYPKDKEYVGTSYNMEIISYVDGLDIGYEDKVTILESLNMTVDSEGNIYWD